MASVEPFDLVRVQVDDRFSMEFRVPPYGDTYAIQDGRRYLIAWATVGSRSAVSSPDGWVELLQRRDPSNVEATMAEPALQPHGWAITRPLADMHYFENTDSLCGEVTGYGGLCYPTFDQDYFPDQMKLCSGCLAALESRSL